MRTVASWVVGIVLVGCQEAPVARVPEARTPAAAPGPRAVAIVVPSPVPPPPAPPAPPALGVVVEGPCVDLDVKFFDNATLVHHGHAPGTYDRVPSHFVLAFRRDDDTIDEDPRLLRGLPRESVVVVPSGTMASNVMDASGSWPDRAVLGVGGYGGERVGESKQRYAWTGDRWQALPHVDPSPPPIPWLAGSQLQRPPAPDPYPAYTVVPARSAPAPDFTAIHVADRPPFCTFLEEAVVARPSGELFVAGKLCGIYPSHVGRMETTVGESGLVRWAPGSPARLEPIPPVADHAQLTFDALLEAPEGGLYLIGLHGDSDSLEPYLAFYDGAAWSRVDVPFKARLYLPHVDAVGTLWVVASNAIYRHPRGGAWVKELGDVKDVAWVHDRPAWAVAGGGVLVRAAGEAGEWTRAIVPRPAFSTSATLDLRRVTVSPQGDVWVRASYEERRPEWTSPEPREALLRVGATRAATRCEASVQVQPTMTDWPPALTEACADPVAILARVGKAAPADYDFPQTRAALRGRAEVASAELVEIELGGRRLLAAKVPSVEVGRALVSLVSHGVKGTRPELVCAQPHVTRSLGRATGGSETKKASAP